MYVITIAAYYNIKDLCGRAIDAPIFILRIYKYIFIYISILIYIYVYMACIGPRLQKKQQRSYVSRHHGGPIESPSQTLGTSTAHHRIDWFKGGP